MKNAFVGLDDIAEILIKKGANVKLARNNGRTALHWAAQRGKSLQYNLQKKSVQFNSIV